MKRGVENYFGQYKYITHTTICIFEYQLAKRHRQSYREWYMSASGRQISTVDAFLKYHDVKNDILYNK